MVTRFPRRSENIGIIYYRDIAKFKDIDAINATCPCPGPDHIAKFKDNPL